jgi:thiol-disulfide isomerase/thioredoxin
LRIAPELLWRLVYVAAIVGICLAAYKGVGTFVLSNARRGASSIGYHKPGMPCIVFFTTPDCPTCKVFQRPALDTLKERLADRIQVIEVDACERPDLAKSWSVLSVPTTFVLDCDGHPLYVNHGAASTEKLLGQLQFQDNNRAFS